MTTATPHSSEHIGADYRLLIDHLNFQRMNIPIRACVCSWLNAIPFRKSPGIASIVVRSYGGWYDGDFVSTERQEAMQFYSTHCPSLLESDGWIARVRFTFADDLLLPPGSAFTVARVRNTVAERLEPGRMTLRPDRPKCTNADCELRHVRRWLAQQHACTLKTCEVPFASTFRRTEQKQVDVHLSMDLLTLAAMPSHHVCLVSDDLDLLPAVVRCSASIPQTSSITWAVSARRSPIDPIVAFPANVKIIPLRG